MPPRFAPLRTVAGFLAIPLGCVITAGWLVHSRPAWCVMWALAGSMFVGIKVSSLIGVEWWTANPWRLLGYLFAWPGLNAQAFLFRLKEPATISGREALVAAVNLGAGLTLLGWATRHAHTAGAVPVAWTGMSGIVLFCHFGVFRCLSIAWRWCGVEARPVMCNPIRATSLSEFWSHRWNTAFADAARILILRPAAPALGLRWATLLVYLLSGLAHEVVVSVPARGGWGGPTLYFLIQGLGTTLERRFGPRAGTFIRGDQGWLWTLFWVIAPLPLLLHRPFAERVLVPLFQWLADEIPRSI